MTSEVPRSESSTCPGDLVIHRYYEDGEYETIEGPYIVVSVERGILIGNKLHLGSFKGLDLDPLIELSLPWAFIVTPTSIEWARVGWLTKVGP